MSSFGPEGLLTDRFPEVESDIQEYQKQEVSKPFKYQSDKLIHQLNSVVATSVTQVNELADAAFSALKLSQAEGAFLDELAFLRGVSRLSATASTTSTQFFLMEPGAIVPAGSNFKSSIQEYTAFNSQPIISDFNNSFETIIDIGANVTADAVGTEYTVTIDSVDYTYTKVALDTNVEVSTGLLAEYALNTSKEWTVVEVIDGSIVTHTLTPAATFTISFTSQNTNITPFQCKMFGTLDLTETGPIEIAALTMDTLTSAVVGVNETNNEEAFLLGRDRETDEALRLRIADGPTSDCTGTVLAIQNSILANVENVITVKVIENITDFPTDVAGRRFGEIETLVDGGDDTEVAEELFRNKGAGVPTFGNVTELITDDEGNPRTVNFSRPTTINVAYKVEYEVYSEEDLPGDAEPTMAATMLTEGTSLGIDEDVIWTRFIPALYTAVPSGIGTINIFMQTLVSPGDPIVPANWSQVTLAIAATEFASTTAADITILQV